MPLKDPEKRREYHRQYMRAWYQKNAKTQIERNQKRRQALQIWFAEFKASLKCSRCGENHPACLEFHRTERTVTTISHWQVRQPLYSRSVGRWRHYEPFLQPLLDALTDMDCSRLSS